MYIIMILCSNVQNEVVCLEYCQVFVISILEKQQKNNYFNTNIFRIYIHVKIVLVLEKMQIL